MTILQALSDKLASDGSRLEDIESVVVNVHGTAFLSGLEDARELLQTYQMPDHTSAGLDDDQLNRGSFFGYTKDRVYFIVYDGDQFSHYICSVPRNPSEVLPKIVGFD